MLVVELQRLGLAEKFEGCFQLTVQSCVNSCQGDVYHIVSECSHSSVQFNLDLGQIVSDVEVGVRKTVVKSFGHVRQWHMDGSLSTTLLRTMVGVQE